MRVQRRGYGRFLISLSYELSKREKKVHLSLEVLYSNSIAIASG